MANEESVPPEKVEGIYFDKVALDVLHDARLCMKCGAIVVQVRVHAMFHKFNT